MRTLWQDLHHSLQILTKNPGFALVAVFTLGLGISANTAIFSTINAVLFDMLPYPQAAELVIANSNNPEKGLLRFGASYQDFRDWEKQNSVFADLAAYQITAGNLTGSNEPQRVRYATTTANLFSTLRVSPALGRAFAPDEEQPGKDRIAILSHTFWQNQFGSDPNVIGKTLVLGGNSVSVIGLMPRGFEFPDTDTQIMR